MGPLKIIFLFSLLNIVSGLTDSDRRCINQYSGKLSNDFLVGRWYKVYKFAFWLDLPPSSQCYIVDVGRTSSSEVERFRRAHGPNTGYSFNDNPKTYIRSGGNYEGMILRDTEMKFFVFDPRSTYFNVMKYEARVYKKINDNFVLFHTCATPSIKWLLSRRRDVTQEELLKVISTIDEVQKLTSQRFCV